MQVKLISHWPFLTLKPSAMELAAKAACKRFDEVESRVRRANRNLDDIKNEIQGLTERAEEIREDRER